MRAWLRRLRLRFAGSCEVCGQKWADHACPVEASHPAIHRCDFPGCYAPLSKHAVKRHDGHWRCHAHKVDD